MNVMCCSPKGASADELRCRTVRRNDRCYPVVHANCGNRHAVVVQDRTQTRLVHAGLERKERTQLRVAILLDYEIDSMRLQERLDLVSKRESADVHIVGLN